MDFFSDPDPKALKPFDETKLQSKVKGKFAGLEKFKSTQIALINRALAQFINNKSLGAEAHTGYGKTVTMCAVAVASTFLFPEKKVIMAVPNALLVGQVVAHMKPNLF